MFLIMKDDVYLIMKDGVYLTKDVCPSPIRGCRKSERNFLLIQRLL